MTLTYEERAEIEAYHVHGGEQFRRTGVYPPRPQRITELQKKATQPKEPDTPPRPNPAPITAAAPVHTNALSEQEAEALHRRTKEIEKKIAENKAEIDARTKHPMDPLSMEMPGMATVRARQRTGKHKPLEASDLDEYGRVVPGRRSFRIRAGD